jgi:NAD(P)-dependent dehydrogenase (short-subunit alcohol dehydrogenase family)
MGSGPDREPSFPRALVVGASSGIGAALVLRLAREGSRVAAVARRRERLLELARGSPDGRVLAHAHDVQRTDEVPSLLERILAELGGLDLFVYAAGAMPRVEGDEYDTEKDLAMVRTNLEGLVAWGNAVALAMREQRSGVIVGISSVAGDRGRRFAPAYCATKAAMNSWLDALHNRLWEDGVHVCTIRPGHVATDMTRGMKLVLPISPDQAARAILAAARARARVRYVPRRWAPVALALRWMPAFVMRRFRS